jgi:hypothetical protein
MILRLYAHLGTTPPRLFSGCPGSISALVGCSLATVHLGSSLWTMPQKEQLLLNSLPTEAVPDSVDSKLGCLDSTAPTDEVEAVNRLALTGHDTALVPLQVGQAGRLRSCDDGGWVVVEEVKIDRDVP